MHYWICLLYKLLYISIFYTHIKKIEKYIHKINNISKIISRLNTIMVEEIAYTEALKNYHHACSEYERIYERCNSLDVNFFQDFIFEKYNYFIMLTGQLFLRIEYMFEMEIILKIAEITMTGVVNATEIFIEKFCKEYFILENHLSYVKLELDDTEILLYEMKQMNEKKELIDEKQLVYDELITLQKSLISKINDYKIKKNIIQRIFL